MFGIDLITYPICFNFRLLGMLIVLNMQISERMTSSRNNDLKRNIYFVYFCTFQSMVLVKSVPHPGSIISALKVNDMGRIMGTSTQLYGNSVA